MIDHSICEQNEVLTASEIMPVMIPVLAASHVCGDDKSRLLIDKGFMPFFTEPI
jgi:hypothetical protein